MKILCVTDFLQKSEFAIDRAGMLAERLGADLTLLHVVTHPGVDRMLEENVQRASEMLKARAAPPLWRHGPAPTVIVRAGNPARILMQTAGELDAGLVVLGTHQKRLTRDALTGAIADRMLGERRCPVLIVRRIPRYPYRNILLAMELSDDAAAIVRAAEALVVMNARATIVHAFEPPHEAMVKSGGVTLEAIRLHSVRWKREALTALRDRLKRVSRDFRRYGIVIEEAPPAEAIRAVAKRVNPDLLVVGTRGHGRLQRALLGSVARRVLAGANSDVLVVPEEQTSTPVRFNLRPWIRAESHGPSGRSSLSLPESVVKSEERGARA